MLTGTSLGAITTNYNYKTYGVLKQHVAQYGLSDIFHADYELDDIGRITGITETCLGKTNVFKYEYDLSGRLVQVSRKDTLISEYFFDDNGNRISYISDGDTVKGIYDNQDRMLSYGNSTYGYTTNGSLKWKIEGAASPHRDTTRYTYDLMGNLLAISLPNGNEIEYLVDAQNRRVGKILNGVVVKKWLYQDGYNIIAELNKENEILSRFIYGSRGYAPDYMFNNGHIYRFITDHLGSIRFVIDIQDGSIVQEITYDEFGNIINDTNPGFQPFGYVGGHYDELTSMNRFRFREYNSYTSRWTNKDPIGFGGKQLNLYTYVWNDPINNIDPNGLKGRGLQGHNSDIVNNPKGWSSDFNKWRDNWKDDSHNQKLQEKCRQLEKHFNSVCPAERELAEQMMRQLDWCRQKFPNNCPSQKKLGKYWKELNNRLQQFSQDLANGLSETTPLTPEQAGAIAGVIVITTVVITAPLIVL